MKRDPLKLALLSPIAGMLFSCSSVAQAKVAAQQAQSALPCQLSEADKVANAELSVPQFDYTPSSSTNARSLANRGCYREAAEAGQDYLAKRQIGDERAHSNVIFHIGQNLAMSGDERAAAMMIAAAKRPSQPADASFDWNTYVFGTWAFLQRNRALLQSSYDVLSAKEVKGTKPMQKSWADCCIVLARLMQKPIRRCALKPQHQRARREKLTDFDRTSQTLPPPPRLP